MGFYHKDANSFQYLKISQWQVDKLNHKNYMIISIDAEKTLDKIQHVFMIETLQKVGTERTYLNVIKTIYDQPTANVILNAEKLKAFPLR